MCRALCLSKKCNASERLAHQKVRTALDPLWGAFPARRLLFRVAMPEISRFFGVVIAMFYREHGVPHFHASYGDLRASVEVETGRLHGQLPSRVAALVLEWRALHGAELLENWQRARDGLPLNPIAPLE